MASVSPSASTSTFPTVPSEVKHSKLVYHTSDSNARKKDFTQGISCILHGYGSALEDGGKRLFDCNDVSQMQVSFSYERNERVISRFIHIKYTGEEDIFGEADIGILIPHCMSRSSAHHREPVIKVKLNNFWTYLNTEEVTVDEYKDVRFVQARLTGGVPGFACVVTRYKRDVIKFSRKATRNTSSVDQRFSIRSEKGCFTGHSAFVMQIEPVDANTVSRVQTATPDGRALMCSSNIVSIAWQSAQFRKTMTVNLPIPANPVKMKKLAKAEAAAKAEMSPEKRRRADSKVEEKANKWYMGIYGEDENDSLFLFHFDPSAETWIHLPEVPLLEIRKDLLSFHMPKPLHRFLVLRCRTEVTPADAKKFVLLLEEQLSLNAVKFILYQNPREHSEVTVYCTSAQKADALYEQLYDSGWRFHGTNGPPTSKQVMLKEGSMFEINFRGNIKFDERFNPPTKKVFKYYNSEMPCKVTFTITEADRHLQRNYDFFKGVCMVQLVDKAPGLEVHQPSLTYGAVKSSTGSLHAHSARRAASNIVPDKKRVLAELMLQLAKGIDSGPQTPPAGKLPLKLDPACAEAIDHIASKLGKEWEVLATNLGLTKGRVEALRTRNKPHPEQVKVDMLYTWVKRQPKSADQLPKLYHALMNCGRIDLAYKVEDLYCETEEEVQPVVDVEITLASEDVAVSKTRIVSGAANANLNNAMKKSSTGSSATSYLHSKESRIPSNATEVLSKLDTLDAESDPTLTLSDEPHADESEDNVVGQTDSASGDAKDENRTPTIHDSQETALFSRDLQKYSEIDGGSAVATAEGSVETAVVDVTSVVHSEDSLVNRSTEEELSYGRRGTLFRKLVETVDLPKRGSASIPEEGDPLNDVIDDSIEKSSGRRSKTHHDSLGQRNSCDTPTYIGSDYEMSIPEYSEDEDFID